MRTRKKAIPRPEYPRPQLVRKSWLNLNGNWEFEIADAKSGEQKGFPEGKGQLAKTILVPFCPESELSGIGNKGFMDCVWYRRNFEIPKSWNKKRILLHFGAVDYETTVWINGQQLGIHRGGYTPFTFEITDKIKPGVNLVVVRAIDEMRTKPQPRGKQSDQLESYSCLYTRTTGIWQTVWLEAVPQTYLQSFKVYPNIDDGTITVHAKIAGKTAGLKLTATAYAGKKKAGEITVTASNTIAFTMQLSEKKLWEPGKPFLYDLELKIIKKERSEVRGQKSEKTLDEVKSYFGLRQISIDGKKVLINHNSVFQRLVLDQGYYPDGIYTAPNDAALKKDIEISLAMGFNGARLHEKVFEPRFLYWADKLGYLVWGEYPNWGMDHNRLESISQILPEWVAELDRDFNHPSIIGWCPFNETSQDRHPELLRIMFRLTKQLDPTRPAIDTSGYVHEETEIYDVHNYNQYPEEFRKLFEPFIKSDKIVLQHFPELEVAYQGQPYFVSEYGGSWWNPEQKDEKAWGYGDRPKTEEGFIERYRGLTEVLLFHPKMFGFCYTQLYDIEWEVNGLYTYHRKPKFKPELIKQINSQIAAIEKEK
ncbi:MAG: glycoside hydrolase family 2 protein [bacterium]